MWVAMQRYNFKWIKIKMLQFGALKVNLDNCLTSYMIIIQVCSTGFDYSVEQFFIDSIEII